MLVAIVTSFYCESMVSSQVDQLDFSQSHRNQLRVLWWEELADKVNGEDMEKIAFLLLNLLIPL